MYIYTCIAQLLVQIRYKGLYGAPCRCIFSHMQTQRPSTMCPIYVIVIGVFVMSILEQGVITS